MTTPLTPAQLAEARQEAAHWLAWGKEQQQKLVEARQEAADLREDYALTIQNDEKRLDSLVAERDAARADAERLRATAAQWADKLDRWAKESESLKFEFCAETERAFAAEIRSAIAARPAETGVKE